MVSDDHGREREVATALAHVRHAVHAVLDNDLGQFEGVRIDSGQLGLLSLDSLLELEAALAGTFGDCADDTVIQQASPVEDHAIDPLLLGLGGQQFSEGSPLFDRRPGTLELLRLRGQADYGVTRLVVDDLCLDVAQAAMYDEPRTLLSPNDLLADAKPATRPRRALFLILVCHDLPDGLR